jgi:hypothetical protein
MDLLIVLLDAIIIVIASAATVYSFKLTLCLNQGFQSGWWGVMPIAFLYAVFNRILVLAVALEYLEAAKWSELIAASTIVFWVLIFIFKFGFYREARKVLCPIEKR